MTTERGRLLDASSKISMDGTLADIAIRGRWGVLLERSSINVAKLVKEQEVPPGNVPETTSIGGAASVKDMAPEETIPLRSESVQKSQ